MKKILVVLLTFSMLCGCQNKKDDGVVKIGVIAPLTGFASLPGEMCVKGLKVAQEDESLNFEYLIVDCKSSTKDALSAYRSLYDEGVRYFIVCGGKFAMAIAPLIKDKDVIMFATGTPNLELLDVTNRCFRFHPNANSVNDKLVTFAQKQFNSGNGAIIYLQTDAYASYADVFEEMTKTKGKIILKEGYDVTQKDFKLIIAKIAETIPDYIYLPGLGESVLNLTKQLLTDPRTANTPIIGDMNFSLPNTKLIIPKTNNPIFYVDAEMSEDFVRRYHEIYQQNPNAFSYYTFLIPYILNDALEVNENQIIDQINYIKQTEFNIFSQIISFDDKGEINLPLNIYSLY